MADSTNQIYIYTTDRVHRNMIKKPFIIVMIIVICFIAMNYLNNSNVNIMNYLNNFHVNIADHNKHEYASYTNISFIIGSRNDNYGGDSTKRLLYTIQQLASFPWFERYSIKIEIIITEWNPILTSPHLWETDLIKSFLKYNKNRNYSIPIIFYVVPYYLHSKISCLPTRYCPFWEYHAKNVGLRRSNGEWKVIINMDDILSLNLMNLIAYHIKHNLFDKNGIYMAQIQQIAMDLIEQHNHYVYNLMAICKYNNSIHFNMDICTKNIDTDSNAKCIIKHKNPLTSCGDFMLLHGINIYKYYLGGFMEACSVEGYDTEFAMRMLYVNKLNGYRITDECSFFHIIHEHQRLFRNQRINQYDMEKITNVLNITIKSNKNLIRCNQRYAAQWRFEKKYGMLPNSTSYSNFPEAVNKSHHTWGFKQNHLEKYVF
eukprot:420951_1